MALIDQDKQYWEKNIKHPNLTTKAFSSVTKQGFGPRVGPGRFPYK